MNEALQFKLQAYFDGELSGREAREISELLAKDAEARALLAGLENTRGALEGFESEVKLPESREFYWSKIEREIQRLERSKTADSPVSVFMAWRRVFVRVSLGVVLVFAGVLVVTQYGLFHGSNISSNVPSNMPQVVALIENSSAVTYRDQETGTTLVWLSYPAQSDFSDTDLDDIL